MSASPTVMIGNQRVIPDRDRLEACQETVDAWLSDNLPGGAKASPAQVIAKFRAQFGEGGVSGGTSVQEGEWFLSSEGWPYRFFSGLGPVDQMYAANHFAVHLIHDNTNADPNPAGPYTHYVGSWNRNPDGSLECANPWGSTATDPNGRYMAYSAAAMSQSTICTVEVAVNAVPPPPPAHSNEVANKLILQPGTSDGYLVDLWGGMHPVGAMPAAQGAPYWGGWNNNDPIGIVADAALAPDGSGGYVMDRWGGLHQFAAKGVAPPAVSAQAAGAYWPGWDIAQGFVVTDWKLGHGYTLDGWGGVHPWPGTPAIDTHGAYWPGGAF